MRKHTNLTNIFYYDNVQSPDCSSMTIDNTENNQLELALCKKKKQLHWPQLTSGLQGISQDGVHSPKDLSQLTILSPKNFELIEINSITLVVKTMLHEMRGETATIKYLGYERSINMTWVKDSSENGLIRAGMNPYWASEFSPYLANTSLAGRIGTVSLCLQVC